MNILLGILLVLFSVALAAFLAKAVKSALAAGTIPKPLITSGAMIASMFLLVLNLWFWTSEFRRGQTDDSLAKTANVLDRLAGENKALRPLVTNAPALIAMGDKLTQTDKGMAEIRADLANMRGLLTNSITLTASMMREQEGRINQLEGLARSSGSTPPPIVNDRVVIQPSLPLPPAQSSTLPTPEVQTPTPIKPAPQAPAIVVAQPQQPQPSLSQQVDMSWKKRTDELARQNRANQKSLQRVGEAATTAQQTASEAMKVATHAQRLADNSGQVATLALGHGVTNMARINGLERRVSEQEAAVQRLLRLLENPEVTVPVPPAYQTPAPGPAVAPVPAPSAPAAPAVTTPQVALMRGGSSDPAVETEDISFAITNTVSARAWKKAIGLPYRFETVAVTYEVGATVKATNNLAAARMILVTIVEEFHKANGGSFAAKDPSDKKVHDELVLAFGEAKKKVLRGNPGWEHMMLHPRYRVSSGEGVVVKTSSSTAPSTVAKNTATPQQMPRP